MIVRRKKYLMVTHVIGNSYKGASSNNTHRHHSDGEHNLHRHVGKLFGEKMDVVKGGDNGYFYYSGRVQIEFPHFSIPCI